MKNLILLSLLLISSIAYAQTTQISISVPTANISDVLNTVCEVWGYQESIPNPLYNPVQFLEDGQINPLYNPVQTIANPQTKAAFARAYLAKIVKQSYQEGKAAQAAKAAEVSSKAITSTVIIN